VPPAPYRSAETEDCALTQFESDFAWIKFFRRTKRSFQFTTQVTIVKTEKSHVDSTLGSDLGRKRRTLAGCGGRLKNGLLAGNLKRKTGFEPATLTLARLWFSSVVLRRVSWGAPPSTQFPPRPCSSPP